MLKIEMRKILAVSTVIVAWGSLTSVGVQAAGTNSVTKPYSLGVGDVTGTEGGAPLGDALACNPGNVSDVCFSVKGVGHTPSGAACDPQVDDPCAPATVHIKAVDASGMPVPMRVEHYSCDPTQTPDPNNLCIDGGAGDQNGVKIICGEGDYAIPDATTILIDVRVSVAGRSTVPVGVPSGPPPMACGQPEPVTQGTITVSGGAVQMERPAHSASGSSLVSVLSHFLRA